MSRYEKGTAGKIVVQDWEVISTYPDSYVLRLLTPRQSVALIALCQFLHWRTRFVNPPAQDDLDAFASETVYRLMQPVDFCALMIECVTTDSDVIEALHNFLVDQITNSTEVKEALNQNYNPQSPNVPMPESVSGQNILPDNPGCDLDVLFGQVSSLIESMNTNNIDSQEIVEALSNAAERVSAVLEGIPILDELPIGDLIDYAQNLWSNDIFENYAATDTTEYRNTLKCDLFCVAQNNGCILSLDDVASYFASRLGTTPSDSVSDVVTYLLTGTWTGTEINDIFYFGQSIFMSLGNKFFDIIGLKPFQVYLQLGEPSDDWLLLCDVCNDSVDIVVYNYPPGFGGSAQTTITFENGVSQLLSTYSRGGSAIHEIAFRFPDGYQVEYIITGSIVATNTGEITALWADGTGAHFTVSPSGHIDDIPTPLTVTGETNGVNFYMNNGADFQLEITLTW